MVEEEWKKLIKDAIRHYLPDENYKIFVFGSRAQNSNRKWSDVDVGIEGPEKISLDTIFQIKEDLAESDIPYRVDIIDFSSASPEFKKVAKESIICL